MAQLSKQAAREERHAAGHAALAAAWAALPPQTVLLEASAGLPQAAAWPGAALRLLGAWWRGAGEAPVEQRGPAAGAEGGAAPLGGLELGAAPAAGAPPAGPQQERRLRWQLRVRLSMGNWVPADLEARDEAAVLGALGA